MIYDDDDPNDGLDERIAQRNRGIDLMERARAARAASEAGIIKTKAEHVLAFLSIMHPEMSDERKREIVREFR